MKPSDSQIPAAPLDLVSAIMDLPKQRLDFVIGFEFANAHPSFEALQQGALSAVQEFPVSGCVLKEKNWYPVPNWQPLSLGDVEYFQVPEKIVRLET